MAKDGTLIMASRKYKRRRILIDPLQYRLLGITFLYFLATTGVFAAALFLPPILDLQAGGQDIQQRASVASEFLVLHRRFWPALLITFVLLSVHSVITSHRIAGPLYRFRAVFDAVRQGDLMAWTGIRARDMLGNEAESLQAMVVSLRERVGRIAGGYTDTRRSFNLLKRAIQAKSMDEARTRLAEHEESILLLGDTVDEFKYEPDEEESDLGRAGSRAFTMIEVLIVVTVIGTLAAIGVPIYMEALDDARVARAIGDISAMGAEISLFWFDSGRYPNGLFEIGRGAMIDPYGNPYEYMNIAGSAKGKKGGGGGGRIDRWLVPVNSDFDLYSMGKDGLTTLAFTAPMSLEDIVRANNGGFIGLAEDF